MFELKPMFASLKELPSEPECKAEWTEKESKKVDKVIKNLFSMKTLTDHRGDKKTLYTMAQIEDFFGLPYTSTSRYAMLGNCNTRFCVDKEEKFNIEFFALTTDDKVVLSAWDIEENEKYFIIG